ncbi:uncharacterized protein LOC103509670 [Diaphorina citri]|uniref:Uncharacterized protein LOC103509670 n=1 Tax=Diaphorina citri TaxID=121845 RepID=A0A1S3D202_DIACI|nr:uncharacterized protein LOC103509670 [Diaphorina citri]XP_008472519.1 uncharacterized protein LOC103509670 [Diaphorina citri]XP_017299762.1 uncharacterized protein LOC103509670 [Diaphorina citri]XP_026679775.1 uncharacterized protein LOC103509670 [Diaphorina citri]KAI5698950.1 hypothetical protein M8J75_014304 [Diaphorina citri]KAI5727606.1 hypothetical protein M8J77_004519 [Diaphorina citri]
MDSISVVSFVFNLLLFFFNKLPLTNGQCELSPCQIDAQLRQYYENTFCDQGLLRRAKRSTYNLISESHDKSYAMFDRYLNLSGSELMKEIENELDNAFDKNLNVSITEAMIRESKGDLSLLKNKTYFLDTYNAFKKSYASKLEHWYLGITLYLPMKMKAIAKEKYFLITRNSLPEKEQLERFWEYERDLDYQFNVFAKKLRDYLQDHYLKLEKTFHQTFTHNTNSTIDLTLFKIVRREVLTSESPYTGQTFLTE